MKLVSESLESVFKSKSREEIKNIYGDKYPIPDYVKNDFKGIYVVNSQKDRGIFKSWAPNTLRDAMYIFANSGYSIFLAYNYQHSPLLSKGYYDKHLDDYIKEYTPTKEQHQNFSTWNEMTIYLDGSLTGDFYNREKIIYADMQTSHSGHGFIYGRVIVDEELIKQILNNFSDLTFLHRDNVLTSEESKNYLDL